jgi:hypothetical protein
MTKKMDIMKEIFHKISIVDVSFFFLGSNQSYFQVFLQHLIYQTLCVLCLPSS